ncbi:hypothetical protein C4E04_18220 [Microvirga sp. 17 mud 1-3]|nr:hypothetical protein C4E04_18220 [Microvirga sp. 17 mud 1-3]
MSFRCSTQMGKAKLTVVHMLDARLRYVLGERVYTKFVREFGVSREAVRSASEGLTFRRPPKSPKTRG